jgi:hypothetical protein
MRHSFRPFSSEPMTGTFDVRFTPAPLSQGRPDPWHAGHTTIDPEEYVVRMLDDEL